MLLSRDAFIATNFPNINEQKPIFCLHSHNEKTFLQDEVFAKLQIDLQNQTVIYMSDAGMPCISDPGTKLIEYARDRGIRYDALPGGSAVTLAYAMSGMGGRTVKKARKQAIFKASCFRAFGMKQGHSLRIHYGRRMEKYCRPISVQPRSSSRYGRRNVAALKTGVRNLPLHPKPMCRCEPPLTKIGVRL